MKSLFEGCSENSNMHPTECIYTHPFPCHPCKIFHLRFYTVLPYSYNFYCPTLTFSGGGGGGGMTTLFQYKSILFLLLE